MSISIKPLAPEAKEFLRNFLGGAGVHGRCFVFAIAMNRGLGWPMVGLMCKEEIYHVGLRDPKGIFWDARGPVDEEKIGDPFGTKSPHRFRSVTEEDLLTITPISEAEINHVVLKKAQALWPNLSWKTKVLEDRVRAFAEELEELSRKHKLWIFGVYPTKLPAIAEGEGDEIGYEVNPDITGLNFFINRKIGP
jgi:hypothetical protein